MKQEQEFFVLVRKTSLFQIGPIKARSKAEAERKARVSLDVSDPDREVYLASDDLDTRCTVVWAEDPEP